MTEALYLDLMKRVLTNFVYGDRENRAVRPRSLASRAISRLLRRRGEYIARNEPFDPDRRREGEDWPPQAHTMIGLRRLDNLQHCCETVLADGVPGDFIETGVWRGGASIFMRAVLAAHGITDRTVWVADSFAGLPPPDADKYPADAGAVFHTADALAVSLDDVRRNFDRYGLLDDQVRFLQGWFRDTLPTAPIERLAVLRLDGDLYESTMDGLANLYDKLSPGGFVIVDDYGAVEACRQAVHDFRNERCIGDEIEIIDRCGAYWRRSG